MGILIVFQWGSWGMKRSPVFGLAILFLALAVTWPSASAPSILEQSAQQYASSNSGIENVQASLRVTGPAVDIPGAQCLKQATFKANAESMLVADPRNPNHLVGASHFLYKFTSTFAGSVGIHTSEDGGLTWQNTLIQGYSCEQNPNILRTGDPVVAMDDSGNAYTALLEIPLSGPSSIYVAKSVDGGATWTKANNGNPIYQGSSTKGDADKQWIVVDNSPTSPYRGTVYVVWVAFFGGYSYLGDIMISKSTDKAETFSVPIRVSPMHTTERGYFQPLVDLGPDGTIYVVYASTPQSEKNRDYGIFDFLISKSTDGGNTFTPPIMVTQTIWHEYLNTKFRTGIMHSLVVNPVNGHVLLAVEQVPVRNGKWLMKFERAQGTYYYWYAVKTDIRLYESSDGENWGNYIIVNDNPRDQNSSAFQPVITVSPHGLVAVAFYDRRLDCPNEPWVVKNDVGKSNFCVDTSIQFYTDRGALRPVGNNIRVTKYSWDAMNGGSFGVGYLTFIGDYFGLAVTDTMAYPFFVATYDLGQNPKYDMQIFVARVKTPINLAQTSTTSSVTVIGPTGTTSSTTTTVETSAPPVAPLAGGVLANPIVIGAIAAVVIAALAVGFLMKRKKKA